MCTMTSTSIVVLLSDYIQMIGWRKSNDVLSQPHKGKEREQKANKRKQWAGGEKIGYIDERLGYGKKKARKNVCNMKV